jgi:hypothetical protein
MLERINNLRWHRVFALARSHRQYSSSMTYCAVMPGPEQILFLSIILEDFEMTHRQLNYSSNILIGCLTDGRWLYIEDYRYSSSRSSGSTESVWMVDGSREGLINKIRECGKGCAQAIDIDSY